MKPGGGLIRPGEAPSSGIAGRGFWRSSSLAV